MLLFHLDEEIYFQFIKAQTDFSSLNFYIMNFQTMHRQRKFILIAAAAGVISMFLPWVSISAFGMDVGQSNNGVRGGGILIFFLFAAE